MNPDRVSKFTFRNFLALRGQVDKNHCYLRGSCQGVFQIRTAWLPSHFYVAWSLREMFNCCEMFNCRKPQAFRRNLPTVRFVRFRVILTVGGSRCTRQMQHSIHANCQHGVGMGSCGCEFSCEVWIPRTSKRKTAKGHSRRRSPNRRKDLEWAQLHGRRFTSNAAAPDLR